MTAKEFTFYLLMSGGAAIALRWLALGIRELARGAAACEVTTPKGEGNE